MQRLLRLPTTTLALHEFGDPSGEPLLFCHGWPGSGRQAVLLDAAAKARGFRIIAPDRPGIGGSQQVERRRMLDWPPLVAEIADALGCARFAVIGVSGGGPYALACAHELAERIPAVAVVSGAPPIAELRDMGGLHPGYCALLKIFRFRPALVRLLFGAARPFLLWPAAGAFLPALRVLLPRPDADALAEPSAFDAVFACNRDAFRDVDGVFADAALYAEPWGFTPEEIRVPVQFWHGRDDANFHWSLAARLAARVPRSTLRIVEDAGHFSTPITHADEILATLRSVARHSASSRAGGSTRSDDSQI